MRASVKPLGATIPSMPGAVAIGGAELSCVPAVPFTYICCSPSSDLLESSAHLAALVIVLLRDHVAQPYTKNSARVPPGFPSSLTRSRKLPSYSHVFPPKNRTCVYPST